MYPETWKNSKYITFRYEKCCSCHRTASVGLRRDSYLGNWALCTHGVTKVDVNKQTALFYECKGGGQLAVMNTMNRRIRFRFCT